MSNLLKVLTLLSLVFVLQALHQAHKQEGIDWANINNKLRPADPDALFKSMDYSGNGRLATFEVNAALSRVLGLSEVAAARDAVNLAYKDSKNTGGTNKYYVEKSEFNTFLDNLRKDFEYYVAFERVDDNSDGRIMLIELKQNQDSIEKWVGKFDVEQEFKKADTNGGGYVLFEEWARWAASKNLDLEDDVE